MHFGIFQARFACQGVHKKPALRQFTYSSCQKENPKLFYKFYLQIWEFKIKYRLRTATIFTTAASMA